MGKITLAVEGSTVGSIAFSAELSSQDTGRVVAHFGRVYNIAPTSKDTVSRIIACWYRDIVQTACRDAAESERAAIRAQAESAAGDIEGLKAEFL